MQSTYASQNEEAKLLIESKDWSSAFLSFTKLITLEGITSAEKSIAYSNRSYVLYNMSKFANAKTDALKSIDSNPKWFKGYLRAAQACVALNDIEGALKFYKAGFGKDGDEGTLEKSYGELYFNSHCPTRMNLDHPYFDQMVEFKRNFFHNREKSLKIYEKLQKNRVMYDKEAAKVSLVLDEMNVVFFENWDWIDEAQKQLNEGLLYNARLCLWESHKRAKTEEGKAKIFEEIVRNLNLEQNVFENNTVKFLSTILPAPKVFYHIDFHEVVKCFWPHMHFHLWFPELMHYAHYFVEEVRQEGKEWIIDSVFQGKDPWDFYECGDINRSKTFYWKFFCQNACAFINGCLASVVQQLIKKGIVPYLTYKMENGTEEKVEVIFPCLMQLIVKKDYINPWCYYKNQDMWVQLLRGHDIGEPYLRFSCGHTVLVLLTKKIVGKENLAFFVDLTGMQYDICTFDELSFPYHEKSFLSGQIQNEEFLFGSRVESAEEYKRILFSLSKERKMYFPAHSWEAVEKNTMEDVKKFLKI